MYKKISRYHKGKASLRQEMTGFGGRQWHQLDHMQTICTSLQTDNHTNTSPVNIYRSDALHHHHHHFICPIIQQYTHLHGYGLEEQDSKVR